MKLVFLFTFVITFNCGMIVSRWTIKTFYLENGSGTAVRLVGYSLPAGIKTTNDTLVDTTLVDGANIVVYSGIGNGEPMFRCIGSEPCDTMKIYKGNALYNSSWNSFKNGRNLDSSSTNVGDTSKNIKDTSSIFYQFFNPHVYEPYETIFFNDGGPEPKEEKCRFLIK